MKKLILLIGMGLFLLASESLYQKARALYETKEYQKAFALLDKVRLKHLSDENFWLLYARCAVRSGHYKDAIASYYKLLIDNPNNIVAKYELAQTYYLIKNYAEAKILLQELLQAQITPLMKKRVLKILSHIEQKREKGSLSTFLTAGLIYDSNVNSANDVDRFYIPSFRTYVPNTTAKKSDIAHFELLAADYLYDIGDESGYLIDNRFVAYFKTWRDYGNNNIAFFSYAPALIYTHNDYRAKFRVGFEKMWYGSHSYLHTLYLAPSVSFIQNPTLSYTLALQYKRKYYEASRNKQRNAEVFDVRVSAKKKIAKWRLQPTLGVKMERKTKSIAPSNVALNRYYTSVDIAYNANSKTTLGMRLFLEDDRYLDLDRFFLNKREDKYVEIVTKLRYRLTKSVWIGAVAGNVVNSSNQTPYDYTKQYININFTKRF